MNEPPPGPPSADEVVFRPSGKEYPREPQIIQGKRSAPEYDLISLQMVTVSEAAQVYADLSKNEVRVPRALADRTLRSTLGNGKAAFGYVVMSLTSALEMEGVEVTAPNRGVVAFRQGKTIQEKMLAMMPSEASPSEVASARAAMSNDRFWELIEGARRRGRNDRFEIAEALSAALRRLRAEEIFGFHILFNERMAEAYRWDLWAVAYIVNGGASDDAFEYFRAWMISQGRAYFETALKNPERAADRAGKPWENECEQLLYVAIQAYQTATSRLPPIFNSRQKGGPSGKQWKEEDLPQMFPNLVKKFR